MKISTVQKWFVAASVAAFLTGNVLAQDSTSAAPQLAGSVSQVLQLSQAKVSDGTIVNYVQNSGTSYPLAASQIIYLKQRGVSDTVLNAMLNQHGSATASIEPTTTTSSTAEQPNATVAPTATYVQSAPASTVYVIPDSQTYRYDGLYYDSYPYYGYYPAYVYPYPAVSLSFGFGGRWGGGYRGGFHGGWHH